MIEEVRAFSGGYCRQLLALIDRRSLRWVKFEAVFLALRHRREGWVLVDTGYGGRFAAATHRFPYRFYRWATPMQDAGATGALLAAAGIAPAHIRHVVVTHFHGDHLGGLAEFPHSVVHHRADALLPLQQLSPWRQTRAAFLPALVPDWLPARAHAIGAESFGPDAELPFATYDLFGDGSLRLVHLPGHAPGQVGLAFAVGGQQELYATDAYWRRSQISPGLQPLRPAMAFQWDPAAYRETVRLLQSVAREGRYRLTACHDDGSRETLHRPRAVA
jgi:glyoxylase-like metal-dependent hydrolase (beta-lactamase superfamily II)